MAAKVKTGLDRDQGGWGGLQACERRLTEIFVHCANLTETRFWTMPLPDARTTMEAAVLRPGAAEEKQSQGLVGETRTAQSGRAEKTCLKRPKLGAHRRG